MKALISLLLVFSFAAQAAPKVAETKPLTLQDLVVEDAKNFSFTFEQALRDPRATQAAVDTVIYDLKHMEELVKDLEFQGDAATNGLTKQVVEEVRRRFRVANALLTSLMIDTKMPLDKKKDYIDEVASALTDVLFCVVREEGEDEDKLIKDMKGGLWEGTKRVFREWASDATVLLRFKRAAKLKEIDAAGKEINAGGTWIPAIADRSRRDALTLELIQEVQESIYMTLNKLDDSDIVEKKYIPTYWGEKKAPQLIKLRSLDLNAERIVATSYVGLAIWGLFAPAFDMVGLLDGGRSEYSLVDSSIIYATLWTSVAAIKASTISTSAVKELKKLVAMTKDQSIEPTRGNISTFWARLGASLGVIKDTCMSALSSKK